jgi:hypothetical protein
MDPAESIETTEPLVEEVAPIAQEGVGDSDKKETEEVIEPQTPRIPKKRAQRPSIVIPIADHKLWGEMLTTKRELEKEATRSRYANLVKF